jgi:hypothetical protein
MEKIIYVRSYMKYLLILMLSSIILNAEAMSKEEFLKKIQDSQQRQEKMLVEIEKTDKFIQKLEEMKKKLEEEKLEDKDKK